MRLRRPSPITLSTANGRRLPFTRKITPATIAATASFVERRYRFPFPPHRRTPRRERGTRDELSTLQRPAVFVPGATQAKESPMSAQVPTAREPQ
jgi:hypothetical protein